MNGDKWICFSVPHNHCLTETPGSSKCQVLIIKISGVQEGKIAALEFFHLQREITLEKLGLAEEDEGRLVIINEEAESRLIPLESF